MSDCCLGLCFEGRSRPWITCRWTLPYLALYMVLTALRRLLSTSPFRDPSGTTCRYMMHACACKCAHKRTWTPADACRHAPDACGHTHTCTLTNVCAACSHACMHMSLVGVDGWLSVGGLCIATANIVFDWSVLWSLCPICSAGQARFRDHSHPAHAVRVREHACARARSCAVCMHARAHCCRAWANCNCEKHQLRRYAVFLKKNKPDIAHR